MATQVQAYKDVIPLDFASAKALPDSFLWLESDDLYSGPDQPSIPVVDLMDPNVAQLIIQACETWGVFQLINHGIPQELVENVAYQTFRVFSLPTEEKLKALRVPSKLVTPGYGNPSAQSSLPRKLWHEGFTIMGSPVDHASVLWPHDYQEFCDVMDDYQKRLRSLSEKLVRSIFKFLSIEVNWFDDPKMWSVLQLNSFPPCPELTGVLGLPAHTDRSLLTILHARTEGFQVFKEGLGWFNVHHNPEALVVNLGDFLHILSNGRFVSVAHRAAVVQKNHRISIAYFYGPPLEATVTLLSKSFADSKQASKYRPVTAEEYHVLKSEQRHSCCTLLEFKSHE